MPSPSVSGSTKLGSAKRRAASGYGVSFGPLLPSYIAVHLARPIPADGGQARLRIVKTYKDEKSYRGDGASIAFTRSVGLPRPRSSCRPATD